MRVLVTGATGLVGSETVEQLQASHQMTSVVGTSRRGGPGGAGISRWDMAVEKAPPELQRSWDVIVNAAADTRWTTSPEEAMAANVETVLALAPIVGERTHVIHISTAYAIGLRGHSRSAAVADYRNAYEWSKAHAEQVAVDRFRRLTIVRPPLIMGRRGDGRAARFTGMYTMLRAMTAGMVPAVIARRGARLDVIPVDELAALIVDEAIAGRIGDVITLAGGSEALRAVTAVNLMCGTLNEWRAERDLEPLECPPIIEPATWERFFLPLAREHLSPRQLKILDLLRNFEPYMAITEPLEPTHTVTDLEPALAASVRYWADSHARQASLSPRPWKLSSGSS